MRFALGCLAVFVLACGHAAAPPSKAPAPAPAEYDRIDTYGSAKLDRERLLARWGKELAQLLRDIEDEKEHEKLHASRVAIEQSINAAGDFAFVHISVITYFSPNRSFLTVDLVDAADRKRRMTFAPTPATTERPDPDGLVALWQEYEEKAMSLLMDGKISPGNEACPFWHCITFAHESLLPYREAFAKRVPAAEETLAEILRDDPREEHRGAAAYLLAHLASGPRVVELLLPSVRDESSLVRNNATRVFALMAQSHPEIALPIEPFIEALDFPETTDRNKSLAVLAGLAQHGDAARRAAIRKGAGERLVAILALRQPNNHDFAHQILVAIAGRDLGERDVTAWRRWLDEG